MSYEKSCGAVICRNGTNGREYLVVLNKKFGSTGHWGFPKGHVEHRENEIETAAREILEETGISVVFISGVRIVTSYTPKSGVEKDCVYFLATPKNGQIEHIQKEELAKSRWCSLADAKKILTYDGKVLDKIERFF